MAQPGADFDGAWKLALDHYLEPFLLLFLPVAHAAIDWTQPPVFRDTELQQIAPEERQGKQHVDRLIQVAQRDGTPALVVIHIEIQSQRDAVFAQRMYRYHARLFDRERQPVVSLAVLGDEDAGWLPRSFSYGLWGCELELRFPVVKLLALDTAYLTTLANPIATLTLFHRDAQETRGQEEERLRRKVGRYRAMLRQGYEARDVRLLLRLMEHLLRLSPELAAVARSQLRQVEQEETGMDTFVTSFEELGRMEERRDLVLRLLVRKVGALPDAVRTEVAALTGEQLLALSEALLDFTTPDDLVSWLNEKRP